MKHKHNLIWIDLEMSGLSPDKERIIEIATIVTDSQLTVLAEGPVYAIKQNKALLDGMDDWNTNQHTKSGLVDRVLKSSIDEAHAEKQTIAFLSEFVEKGKSPMCGNSVHQDRRFLCNYMPALNEYFHYRNLDVSTLKELVKRWNPKLLSGVKKESKHLALDDIKDSIEELRYYREHFIVASEK
jgi:oligoribonuclease